MKQAGQVLSEIYLVPRFAAILSFVCCILWYRFDGHNGGLWSCLLALAGFVCVNKAILAILYRRAMGTEGLQQPKKISFAVLKALGLTSGTMSSLQSAVLVTILILAGIATFFRIILRLRGEDWWQCIALALTALNAVSALPPTMLLAACRWSKGFEKHTPDLKSAQKLLNSLHTSTIILDASFLDRSQAEAELQQLKQAQIQVLFVESRAGADAEKAMSETILLGEDGKSLPLVVKLGTVLEAKETDEHPCRDVYILLNDAPVAVVSGVLLSNDANFCTSASLQVYSTPS